MDTYLKEARDRVEKQLVRDGELLVWRVGRKRGLGTKWGLATDRWYLTLHFCGMDSNIGRPIHKNNLAPSVPLSFRPRCLA